MRRLGAHVAAGGVTSAITILSAVLATPLYLRALGAEAYGVLAFVLALQAALLALDAGIGVSITRAVARAGASNEVGALVYGLDRMCWALAAIIGVLPAALSPLLSERWLNVSGMDRNLVMQALALGGAAIGLRWPVVLYQGVLIGAQRVPSWSLVSSTAILAGAGGGVLWMTWLPDVRLLLAWLAAVGLAQALCCRHLALASVAVAAPAGRPQLTAFMRNATAAAGLGVVGLLILQVDKAVLSKVLPLADFGYYTLAAMMVASLYAVVVPVFNVLYPRLAQRASGDPELQGLYRASTLALGALVFPLAAVMAAFGDSLLLLWIGDARVAATGAPVVFWLALGTALHAIMYLPFALKLARGRSGLALAISASVLVLAVPLTLEGARRGGAPGAAAAWFTVNAVYFAAGAWVTHRLLLPGQHARWLLQDVLPPLVLAFAVAFAFSALVPVGTFGPAARTFVAMASVVACWLLAGSLSGRLRRAARDLFSGTS